jgi:hypothetical protein
VNSAPRLDHPTSDCTREVGGDLHAPFGSDAREVWGDPCHVRLCRGGRGRPSRPDGIAHGEVAGMATALRWIVLGR